MDLKVTGAECEPLGWISGTDGLRVQINLIGHCVAQTSKKNARTDYQAAMAELYQHQKQSWVFKHSKMDSSGRGTVRVCAQKGWCARAVHTGAASYKSCTSMAACARTDMVQRQRRTKHQGKRGKGWEKLTELETMVNENEEGQERSESEKIDVVDGHVTCGASRLDLVGDEGEDVGAGRF
jgi:hypothetical protein